MSSGDSLYVELSKDAIEGTLKIGNEIFPVYVSRIDFENISHDLTYETSDGKISYPKIKIIRKFVLIER